MSESHTYAIPDGPKMLRETLCIAQSAVQRRPHDDGRKQEHAARIGRLIDECDRKRPLGNDGKHGDRHTTECGCMDRQLVHESAAAARDDLTRLADSIDGDSGWEHNSGCEGEPDCFACIVLDLRRIAAALGCES